MMFFSILQYIIILYMNDKIKINCSNDKLNIQNNIYKECLTTFEKAYSILRNCTISYYGFFIINNNIVFGNYKSKYKNILIYGCMIIGLIIFIISNLY
jgi:hypothetical protein